MNKYDKADEERARLLTLAVNVKVFDTSLNVSELVNMRDTIFKELKQFRTRNFFVGLEEMMNEEDDE